MLLLIATEESSHNPIKLQAEQQICWLLDRACAGAICCMTVPASSLLYINDGSLCKPARLTWQYVFVSVLLDILLLLSCIGGVNLLRPVFC